MTTKEEPKFEHTICVRPLDDDRKFEAWVVEMSGCLAHGETEDAAREAAVAAGRAWMEKAKEEGRPIPTPIEQELAQRAAGRARANELHSSWLEEDLDRHLNQTMKADVLYAPPIPLENMVLIPPLLPERPQAAYNSGKPEQRVYLKEGAYQSEIERVQGPLLPDKDWVWTGGIDVMAERDLVDVLCGLKKRKAVAFLLGRIHGELDGKAYLTERPLSGKKLVCVDVLGTLALGSKPKLTPDALNQEHWKDLKKQHGSSNSAVGRLQGMRSTLERIIGVAPVEGVDQNGIRPLEWFNKWINYGDRPETNKYARLLEQIILEIAMSNPDHFPGCLEG